MKILYITIILFLAVNSHAQITFQKVLSAAGNQVAVAVALSILGDYYLLSETDTGIGAKDFLLTKLDVNGTLLWSKTYGTIYNDVPTAVKVMSNGKIMLCGNTNASGDWDILLIETDTAGNTIWSKTFGGLLDDFGNGMVASSDSQVVVVGQTYSYGVINSSGYVIKVNTAGGVTWSLTDSGFSTATDQPLVGIATTLTGNYILIGYRYETSIYHTSFVEITPFGTIVSSTLIGGPTNTLSYDVTPVPGGDFLITGRQFTNGTDTSNILVTKASPTTFMVSLSKNIYSTHKEIGRKAFVTPDGYFAIVASDLTTHKGLLIKISQSGNIVFGKSFSTPSGQCDFKTAIISNDSTFFMVGSVKNYLDPLNDIYIVKADLSGSSGCSDTAYTPFTSSITQAIGIGSNTNFGASSASLSINTSSAPLTENTLCNVTGVTENIHSASFNIYPNPAKDICTIDAEGFSNASVSLYDIASRILYNQVFNNQAQLSVSHLAQGVYFVVLKDAKGRSMTSKLLKN